MDADWIITLLIAQLEDTDLAAHLRAEVADAGESLRGHTQYDDFALELAGRYGQRAVSVLEPQLISVESMGAAYLAGLNLGLAIAATGDSDWPLYSNDG